MIAPLTSGSSTAGLVPAVVQGTVLRCHACCTVLLASLQLHHEEANVVPWIACAHDYVVPQHINRSYTMPRPYGVQCHS